MGYTTLDNIINFSSRNISHNRSSLPRQNNTGEPTRLQPRRTRQDLMIALEVEQSTVKMQLMGKLNSTTIPVFNGFLQTFADDGYISFVFDLSDLTGIDRAGISALAQANKQLEEVGGKSTITNSNEKLLQKLSGSSLTIQ